MVLHDFSSVRPRFAAEIPPTQSGFEGQLIPMMAAAASKATGQISPKASMQALRHMFEP
jgi:hypothetical protein